MHGPKNMRNADKHPKNKSVSNSTPANSTLSCPATKIANFFIQPLENQKISPYFCSPENRVKNK